MKKIAILYLILCLPCEVFLPTFSSSWKIAEFSSFFSFVIIDSSHYSSLILLQSFESPFFHSSFWLLLKCFPIVINNTAIFKEPSLILKFSFIDFQTRIFHPQWHELDKWSNSAMNFTRYRRKILLYSDNNVRYIKPTPLEHFSFQIFSLCI